MVLGIDALAKEGLDIPDLNTLIFATPAGVDVEQPVGRILRKFHKGLNPMVIDLVDNTGNYVKHSKHRDAWYTDENYVIQDRHIQLVGTTWTEQVQGYIHTQDPPPQKIIPIEEPEPEPELEICMLLESGEALPEPQAKTKAKITARARIQAKAQSKAEAQAKAEENATAPSNNLCLLPPAPKLKPASRTTPDFNVLML